MRRLTGLVLTVAAICSALVLRAHRSSSASEHQTPTLAPVVAVAEPHSRNQLESAHFSPATNSPSSKYPLVVPGFVLQVGAMTNEKNAEALSERLQRKHFPTFVFKRSTDRFYQVDVGSFADVDSAAVVKRELEKRGFKPILRYWSPS
jgi:cell division septation protein DedD